MNQHSNQSAPRRATKALAVTALSFVAASAAFAATAAPASADDTTVETLASGPESTEKGGFHLIGNPYPSSSPVDPATGDLTADPDPSERPRHTGVMVGMATDDGTETTATVEPATGDLTADPDPSERPRHTGVMVGLGQRD